MVVASSRAPWKNVLPEGVHRRAVPVECSYARLISPRTSWDRSDIPASKELLEHGSAGHCSCHLGIASGESGSVRV